MIRSLVLSSVVGLTSLYTTIHFDNQASGHRPDVDFPRAVFCAKLLATPGWQTSTLRITEPRSTERVLDADQLPRLRLWHSDWLYRPAVTRTDWPLARAYDGPARAIDERTMVLWSSAENLSHKKLRVEGTKDIRALLETILADEPEYHRPAGTEAPAWMREWASFKDFQTLRYAAELGDVERALDDYAAGRNLDRIVFALSRLSGPARLSSFLTENAAIGLGRTVDENLYFWHVLYFDRDSKTPVWRAGTSRQF